MNDDEHPTLRDLVQRARDTGLSYRQMEEIVEAAEARERRGLQLNRTTASKIARGAHSGDAADGTIRAIALVAGVSEDVAFAAAGRKLSGTPFFSELPAGIDDLSTRERRVALDFLRVLVSQRQEINRYEYATDSSPQPRAPSEAGEDQKNNVRALKRRDQAPSVNADVETLNPDDEVTEEEFQTAARFVPGKSPGEIEYEEHAAAGEESQESFDEDGA